MRFWVRAVLLGTGIVGVATAAQAEREPIVLQPSSQWNVDFAPTKCRLTRTFGEGEDLHLLSITQYNPDQSAGLTLAGPNLSNFRSRSRTWLTINEQQKRLRTEPLSGDVEGYGPAVIYSDVNLETGQDDDDGDSAQLAQLDSQFADSVEFIGVRQRRQEIRFATGPLKEAFEVMNSCTQDMLRDWGLDVEKHLTATQMPVWKNENSITRRIQSVYPSKALARGVQEIVRMRVIVDENGSVESCVIEAATDGGLESPACRAMMNAEFEPARDADGQPLRSFYAGSITYLIS